MSRRKAEYGDSFGGVRPVSPPAHLFHRITDRIRSEEKIMTLRRRAVCFTFAFGVSVIAFLGACVALQSVLVQSELLQVLSLLFSDPEAVLVNWRDFGLFVLESLPALSLVGLLGTLFILLASAKYAVQYFAKMLSVVKHARRHLYES